MVFHVRFHERFGNEVLAADFAAVRFDARMGPLVDGQRALLGVAFTANVARVRFLAGVNACVNLK